MVSDTEESFFAVDPVEVDISFGEPLRQRRSSIALRGLLFVPLLVVVGAVGIVGAVLAIIGWFAALVLGRLPRWIAVFQLKAIAYAIGVNAYAFLLIDKYPPFALPPPDYPLALKIGASRLSRAKVLFRWLLFIPAGIVSGIAFSGLRVLGLVIWLITLVRGRPPQAIFGAAAAVIRYEARYYAYMSLLTDMYPRRLFGDGGSDWVGGHVSETEEQDRREFRVSLSAGARRLVALILVLGLAASIASGVLRVELQSNSTGNAELLAAEVRFEVASQAYLNGIRRCGTGATRLRCSETQDRAWGEAFEQFASSLSLLSFPGSKAAQAAAVVRDSRQIGQALIAASRAKTLDANLNASLAAQTLLPRFAADAESLLGHGL